MRGPLKATVLSAAAIAALIAILMYSPSDRRTPWSTVRGSESGTAEKASNGRVSLLLYCAAGVKGPAAAVARSYEDEYGVGVQIQYGGSGTLLSNLSVSRKGDLYLAADSTYIELAQERGLVEEAIPVASMRALLIVPKGNPKGIQSVADLTKPDVRIALGEPGAASIGERTQALLMASGHWSDVEAAVRARGVFKPTVNDVANDVRIGAVDAGIVWDATANQYPELEGIHIPGAKDFAVNITVGVLKSTTRPTAALQFARYLSARDRGLIEFDKQGFPPVDGDQWAEVPEILYFSGGVNRVAIQDTIREFQEREGVRVTTVYNGCGILVGQMKLGERPDVYHSCDASFMRGLEYMFRPAITVSETDMVMLVAQGNPLDIQMLKDLTKPDLRIGIPNEKQSALGALAARMLREEGLYESVMANVTSQTPTADLLVNQIRTGSLDAVIVYEANTIVARKHLDVVPITLPAAKAEQTFAIGAESNYKHLASRLFAALEATASDRFETKGFHWKEAAHRP